MSEKVFRNPFVHPHYFQSHWDQKGVPYGVRITAMPDPLPPPEKPVLNPNDPGYTEPLWTIDLYSGERTKYLTRAEAASVFRTPKVSAMARLRKVYKGRILLYLESDEELITPEYLRKRKQHVEAMRAFLKEK